MSDASNAKKSAIELDLDQIEQVSKVFFEESRALLEELDKLLLRIEEDPEDKELLGQLFRNVHTLKGSSGPVPGSQMFGALAHEFEALIEKFRSSAVPVSPDGTEIFMRSAWLLKAMAENLRMNRDMHPDEVSEVIETIGKFSLFQMPSVEQVAAARAKDKPTKRRKKKESRDEEDGVWLSIDQLSELLKVGSEFVVLRNYHIMMNQAVSFRHEPELFEKRQSEFAMNLNKLTDQLQEQMVKVQKVKVADAFDGLHALIRQVSHELKKEVVLHPIGFDRPIDRNLASDLYQVLVHILRNSLDHGIERPDERVAAGKTPEGHITLAFEEKNGVIFFKVSDDGRGLNKEKIIKRAIQNKLVEEDKASFMSDEEILALVMKPGFSTAEKVSSISGRGIGMDVVKDKIESYGGRISLKSKPGLGLDLAMQLPVPRNVMVEKVLLCSWDEFQVAVPLLNVARIISCSELHLTEVDGLRFCQFDGVTVPLLTYREISRFKCDQNLNIKDCTAVFIRTREGALALIVDSVSRQADLVIRSFNSLVKSVKGFKGSSVLADDKVTYIIDPPQLLNMVLSGGTMTETKEAA